MLRERCDLAHALILFFFFAFFLKNFIKKKIQQKKREVYTLYGTHYTRWPNKETPKKDENEESWDNLLHESKACHQCRML